MALGLGAFRRAFRPNQHRRRSPLRHMKSTASRSVAVGNSRNTKHVQTGYLGKLEYFTNLKNKALLG